MAGSEALLGNVGEIERKESELTVTPPLLLNCARRLYSRTSGANLLRVDLTDADLLGANLTNAILTGAIFNNTTMPDGTIR